MRQQLANSSADISTFDGMSKAKNILSFRPNEWEQRAVQAAEEATGFKRSELLRRCVSKSLGQVVREILSTHSAAVDRFDAVLRDAPHATTAAGAPDPHPYKISRKPRKPAAIS